MICPKMEYTEYEQEQKHNALNCGDLFTWSAKYWFTAAWAFGKSDYYVTACHNCFTSATLGLHNDTTINEDPSPWFPCFENPTARTIL